MKKPVNTDVIANELREGSAFFRQARHQVDTPEPQVSTAEVDQTTPQKTVQPTNELAEEPAGHSTSQLTGRSTDRVTAKPGRAAFDTTAILGRPKSFYITERQDRELDVAVTKLQEKLKGRGNQKIDRSTVMRLLLEVNNITEDSTVDRLASQLVSRLVSQLTG